MKEKKVTIRANKNAPYIIEGACELKSSQGDVTQVDSNIHICRCGKSNNKPFCDKTHEELGFTSKKLDGRQPDKTDKYIGKQITIFDNRGVCSHKGACTTNLPKVFIMGTEPWINPDGADPKEVARVIRMCPSGALSYEWNGTKYSDWEEEQTLTLSKNGPLEVKGGVEFYDEEGSLPATKDHTTLCRCGGSKNKPFCDGTHWYNGFKDDKELVNENRNTTERHMKHIHHMADTGNSIIEPMGPEFPLPDWKDITISGAQLSKLPINEDEPVSLKTIIGPKAKYPLEISMPVYVTHMSFGALSKEAKIALSSGSAIAKTAMCSGEGGIIEESMQAAHKYIFEYVQNEYSTTKEHLEKCDAVEIKIGQAVKPGIGGHFPAAKITAEIGLIRNKPLDKDIVTPARYPDIFDAESLKKKVSWLRDLSNGKPIGIKLAAGKIEDDLKIAVAAEPDFITIDGKGGATGSVMKFIKDSASTPTLFALARARKYFIDNNVQGISLIITGGLRVSSDFAKALAMGADAVAIGTAALMAIGCQQYRMCDTGNCPTGIASQNPELRARLNVKSAAERLGRFFDATKKELEVFTRMTGNKAIKELSVDDLSTYDVTISKVTGIILG